MCKGSESAASSQTANDVVPRRDNGEVKAAVSLGVESDIHKYIHLCKDSPELTMQPYF